MSLRDVATDPRLAYPVSAATTATGTFFDMIPSDIGKLATLVGIALSIVLIYTHLRKGRIEYKKIQLEMELLRMQREG